MQITDTTTNLTHNFKPNLDPNAEWTLCVSNITRCTSEFNWIAKHVTPTIMAKVFGKRITDFTEPERGYSTPVWLWSQSPGTGFASFGIGFRWGCARLIGNWENTDAANQFIAWIKEQITKKNIKNVPIAG